MTPILASLLAGSAIMLCALVGVITTLKAARSIVTQNLPFFVSFSAGVFLVIALSLLTELVLHSDTTPFYHNTTALLSIGAGIGLMVLMSKIPEYHHHHIEENHYHSHRSSRNLIMSDAIHNIGDGVIVATAFISNMALGLAAAGAIVVHELIQELSEFFVLRQNGYSIKKALLVNFAVSTTILVGIALVFFLESISGVETVLLGLASGTLLVVVFHDLIPRSFRDLLNKRTVLRHALAFCIGIGIMFVVNALLH